ncbi:hypothetical protein GOV12_06495 [Candidatus Pacearchaeota archaeon]|nr:hypothetical protein [Candidatus Pacearchaeota archaeon]
MFNLFTKKAEKRELELLKQAVQTGFNSCKQDINKTGEWVKHLNTADSNLKYEIFELQEEIASMREEMEMMRNKIDLAGVRVLNKQTSTVLSKQTASRDVLNSVQTDVQTVLLDNLSITERAIIFVLLNSDMKLSYEDLASMLGKRTATIRGQINSIKQKSEGLIEEIIGENNKKRVYIPEKLKDALLRSKKVKNKRNRSKNE